MKVLIKVIIDKERCNEWQRTGSLHPLSVVMKSRSNVSMGFLGLLMIISEMC